MCVVTWGFSGLSGASNDSVGGLFEDTEKGLLQNQVGGGRKVWRGGRNFLFIYILFLDSSLTPQGNQQRARADTQETLQDQGTRIGGNNAFSKFLC